VVIVHLLSFTGHIVRRAAPASHRGRPRFALSNYGKADSDVNIRPCADRSCGLSRMAYGRPGGEAWAVLSTAVQAVKTTDVVRSWRFSRLLTAGYPAPIAREFSERPEIDLHAAIRLLERGCEVETAIRILR
jgi:hypothetical protein